MAVYPEACRIAFELKCLCVEIGTSLMPGGCDERVRGDARHCVGPARMYCVCSTLAHSMLAYSTLPHRTLAHSTLAHSTLPASYVS